MKNKMISVRKADEKEKSKYYGVYPLYGFIKSGDFDIAIEDLRSWSKPNPQYEVIAPEGYHFFPDGTHTLLCHDMKDIKERVSVNDLELCDNKCSCK